MIVKEEFFLTENWMMVNSIDEIDSLVSKFKFHLSILKIKQKFNITEKFSFKEVSVDDMNIIRNISTNKPSGGGIPL